MKKLLSACLTLAVCSAALCLAAAAEEPAVVPEKPPAITRVWGKVSPWEGEGIFLKNDNESDYMNEVVVHVGEAPVVDAATGLPLDMESVKEGDTLYAWIGPVATMSLPPQVFAEVIVGNIPADAAAPEYCEIAGAAVPGKNGEAVFPVSGGGTLTVTEKTAYSPWLTRQIVRMENLIPGARALVWKGADGKAEKVIIFAYDYQGYISWQEDGTVRFSGEKLPVSGRKEKNEETGKDIICLPLRPVAEAAGYEVRWDKDKGAVVSLNGETIFSVKPGAEVIQTAEGEASLSFPCVKENGVTYLPAEDMCRWLNLFTASKDE